MGSNKSPPNALDMKLAAEIYERNKGVMLKTAVDYLNDKSLAQDVVHDAVIRLAHYADTLRRLGEAARMRYAVETVRSVAMNSERKLKNERKYMTDPDAEENYDERGTEPLESAYIEKSSRDARLRYLREALDELDEQSRAVLVGKYLIGETDDELAARIGVKASSVRMILTRARRAAKRIIEGKEGGDVDK